MTNNAFAQAGNQVNIPGVNSPAIEKEQVSQDLTLQRPAEGITTASGITDAQKEKAKNFIASEGLTSKDSVNDYVRDNFDGDASKFFSDVTTDQAQAQANTINSTDSELAIETAKARKDNADNGDDIEANREQAIKDAEAQKTADLAREAEFAKENEAIINSQNDAQAEIEEQKRETAEEQKDANLALLKEKEALAVKQAEDERSKLEAEAEYQKIQNENAIIQAEAAVDIERQQSAWAYQKIGLGFSSGIINQSQQIATNGIVKIAEIKAKMNYEEALVGVEHSKINNELKGIELEYTGMINDTINIYSDKLDDLDESALIRLQEVEKNLLINNQEKKTSEDEILKEYRAEQQSLERQHMEDMQAVSDRGLELTEKITLEIEKQESISKDKVNDSITSGGWFNMSDVQKEKSLKEAGLTVADGRAMENKIVGDSVVEKVYTMMPEDFAIDPDTKLKLRNEVDNLLDLGYTLDSATDRATSTVIKDSPEYKKMKETEATEEKLGGLENKAGELELNAKIKEYEQLLSGAGISYTGASYAGTSSGGSSSGSSSKTTTTKTTSTPAVTTPVESSKTNYEGKSYSAYDIEQRSSKAPSAPVLGYNWKETARLKQSVEDIKNGDEPSFNIDEFMNSK